MKLKKGGDLVHRFCGVQLPSSAGLFFLILTVCSATGFSTDAAGWESMNPGGGGQIQNIVCDPSIDGRLYVCSDMEGLYRSDDNGLSWDYIGDGLFNLGVMTVAADPNNTNRLVAATEGGIFISDNLGKSWGFASNTEARICHQLVIDPNDSDRIYAAPGHHESSVGTNVFDILVSRDGGDTWQSKVYKAGTGTGTVYSVKIDPADSSRIYIGGVQGMYKSTDFGDTWTPVTRPSQSSGPACYGLDISPDGNFIYAAYAADNSSSLFVAPLSTLSWSKLSTGLSNISDFYWRPMVDLRSTASQHKVLVGPLLGYGNPNLFEGTFTVSGTTVSGSWVSAANYNYFDRGWYSGKHRFRHNAYTPAGWSARKVWSASEFVLFEGDPAVSNSWALRSCQTNGTEAGGLAVYKGRGFTSTFNWNVAGDDRDYLITGAADIGVLESWDAGESWRPAGLTGNIQGDSVLICKTDPEIVLASLSEGYGGTGTNGNLWAKTQVYRSSADLWKLVAAGSNGLAGLASTFRIGAMASDPFNPDHVIVGGRQYTGLYETDDISTVVSGGAASFSKIFTSGALSSASVRNIYFDPLQTNTMYVLSNGGLYRCSKTGGTWTSEEIYETGTASWADQDICVWAHNGETRIALCNPDVATNDADAVLLYWDSLSTNWSEMLTLGGVKSLYDEGDWCEEWGTIRASTAFGYQNRLICAVTALAPKRKDLGVFCGNMKNGSVAWENWSDVGAGRLTYSCGRGASLVNVGGIPYMYLATTGAGVWRRALGEAETPNMIYNGGFETGFLAPDWDDVWPKLDSTPTNVYAGKYSMRLQHSQSVNMDCYQTVEPCSSNAAYVLSARIKTALTAGTAGLKVLFYQNGTLLSSVSNYPCTGTSGYQLVSLPFTTPPLATKIKINLQTPNPSQGSAWFDEVKLEEVGMLVNPDFETGELSPDWDADWPKIETNSACVYEGNYSMRLQHSQSLNMQCRQTVVCSADTEYTLSAQIKTALTAGSAGLKVQFYKNLTPLGSCTNYANTGTSDYHSVFLDFKTPTNATAVKVFLQTPDPSQGSAWFDNVRLQ
jgi:hypothetical protein